MPARAARIAANCYVRAEPRCSAAPLGVAKRGSVLARDAAAPENGWLAVAYRGQAGWVRERFVCREQ